MTSRSAKTIIDMYGNAPAWMIYSFFNTLAPTHHMLDKFVGAYRSNSSAPATSTLSGCSSDGSIATCRWPGRYFSKPRDVRDNSLMKGR